MVLLFVATVAAVGADFVDKVPFLQGLRASIESFRCRTRSEAGLPGDLEARLDHRRDQGQRTSPCAKIWRAHPGRNFAFSNLFSRASRHMMHNSRRDVKRLSPTFKAPPFRREARHIRLLRPVFQAQAVAAADLLRNENIRVSEFQAKAKSLAGGLDPATRDNLKVPVLSHTTAIQEVLSALSSK